MEAIMTETKTDFYTVKQVSEMLQVAISTVHGYIKDSLLDAYQIGGRGPWRISVKEYDDFLERHTVYPTTEGN